MATADAIGGPLMEDWLQRDTIVHYYPFNATTTSYVQLAPYEPDRFCLILPCNYNANFLIIIGDQTTGTPNMLPASAGFWPIFHRRDMGDLLCYPWWIKLIAGTLGATTITCSYNPKKKEKYHEWAARQFS